MEGCSSSLDRISNLSSHISQIILMSLPLRDMARTSILSKSWRYQWLKVPQLVFKDDPKYLLSREEKYRYTAMKVFEILLLHHGPILKFSLDMTAWQNFSVIDRIIPFLSRNGLKELTLLLPNDGESYKLPSSILSCIELRHLSLSQCVFQPLTIAGFSKLVSLELFKVTLDSDDISISCLFLESLKLDILSIVKLSVIRAPNLKKLHFKGKVNHICIEGTPLLKVLSLINTSGCYTENSSLDFICLFDSLPLLEELNLCYSFLKMLAEGDSSTKFPMMLSNLRMLELMYVDIRDEEELSSTLCLLRSSPNIQKLKFSQFGLSFTPFAKSTEWGPVLNMPEHTRYALLKLNEVEIELHYGWCHLRGDMEFFKFLLDISPALKTFYIKASSKTIDVSGYKMLAELACYGRASPKSEIVYGGVDLS